MEQDDRTMDEHRAAEILRRSALRRMVQTKNRAKGPWTNMSRLELIRLARVELDEAETAIEDGETEARIESELGDVAAFIAMALDNSLDESSCCCLGRGHDRSCCPGFFVNDETGKLERCDDCGIFAYDEDVDTYVETKDLLTTATEYTAAVRIVQDV